MQVGDVSRRRRGLDGRDSARKSWYARHRQCASHAGCGAARRDPDRLRLELLEFSKGART